MRKISLTKRISSAFCAAALACTTVPLASLSVTSEKAYAADGPQAGAQISVKAPVAVVFGANNGYDVASKPASIEERTSFTNNGQKPVYLSNISSMQSTGSDTKYKVENALTGTNLSNQQLFSIFPTDNAGKAKSFKPSDNQSLQNTDGFAIASGDTLPVTFRLNLTNTSDVPGVSATVDPNKADNAASVKYLSKITYTFTSFDVTNAGTHMYLMDRRDGHFGDFYTLEEIKKHAQDISEKGSSSEYYAMYDTFSKDIDKYTYECAMIYDNQPYLLDVIGVNHDTLADGSGKKAGITFQFTNKIFGENFKLSYDDGEGVNVTFAWNGTNTFDGAWGESDLRDRMNPEPSENGKNNTDNLWDAIPEDIQNAIAPVQKQYQSGFYEDSSTLKTSDDHFFLPSVRELNGSFIKNNSKIYENEGSPYAYYVAGGTVGRNHKNYLGNAGKSILIRSLWCVGNTVSDRGLAIVSSDGVLLPQGASMFPTAGVYSGETIAPMFCL